jgi:hypothetical protein
MKSDKIPSHFCVVIGFETANFFVVCIRVLLQIAVGDAPDDVAT